MVLVWLNRYLVRIVKHTKQINDGGFNFLLKLDKKKNGSFFTDKNKQKTDGFFEYTLAGSAS